MSEEWSDPRVEVSEPRFKVTERYVSGWTDWRAIYPTKITWRYKLRLWWRESAWRASLKRRIIRAYVRYRMRWTRNL